MEMHRQQISEMMDSIYIFDWNKLVMHASAKHDEAKIGIQTLDKDMNPVGKLASFNDVE